MLSKPRTTLRQLLESGQVFAPCVWDGFSLRAAELTGFKAALLSGGALGQSIGGLPDVGLMTAEELIWATERLAAYSPLPLIVDADDGYGETAIGAYRTAGRLARAGAMAVTIDDTTGWRGYERWGRQLRGGAKDGEIDHPVVSRETFLAKMRASLEACADTDCMLIARTESKLKYGLDEAIERLVRAVELGAEMTLVIGLMNLDEAETVARALPGWKMYPDVGSIAGVPDARLEDLAALGYNLVTMHYLEKAAMFGMLDYGRHVIAEGTTVYPDCHDMGGLAPSEWAATMPNDPLWLEREREWLGSRRRAGSVKEAL